MNPESLIFDVDGTLWNSVDLVVRGGTWRWKRRGCPPACTPGGFGRCLAKPWTRLPWPSCLAWNRKNAGT